MTFYFRTFRRVLSGTMLFTSAISVILAFLMLPSFSRNAVPWYLVAIQTLSFMRTLWSFARKALLNSIQSVASEGIGLFSLFPFQLILALIIATTEFKVTTSPIVYILLQVFVIVGAVIHIVYTICLILVAVITVSAFDRDVWIRDIDSSPSPFPMSVLSAYVSTWWSRVRYGEVKDLESVARTSCIPPCTCSSKPEPSASPELDRSPEQARKAKSLPHSLIRVPDAAEQRASIIISFDVT